MQTHSALVPYSTSSISFCFRFLSNKIQKKDEKEINKLIKNPDHFLLLLGSTASLLEKSLGGHSPSQPQLQRLNFPRFPSKPCQ